MLFSNTDGRTYAKETPRSVLLDICSSWNTNGSVCSAGSGSRAALTRSATWCRRTALAERVTGSSAWPSAALRSRKARPHHALHPPHSASKSCALIYLSFLNCLDDLHSFYRLVLQQCHGSDPADLKSIY